jgi:hypothetical protein
MNDQQIIDLLQHSDWMIQLLWTEGEYTTSETHKRITEAIRVLRDRQPTTIGELEKQGRI